MEDAENPEKNDAENDSFVTHDGKVLSTLRELAKTISEMSDDVFRKHVSDNKNEFAEWIRKVHKKEDLAEELMKELSKEGHKKIILHHITRDYKEE